MPQKKSEQLQSDEHVVLTVDHCKKAYKRVNRPGHLFQNPVHFFFRLSFFSKICEVCIVVVRFIPNPHTYAKSNQSAHHR